MKYLKERLNLPRIDLHKHNFSEKRKNDDVPQFSIIVVMWNNFELNKKCIESIKSYSRDYELIIIDNGSSDETVGWLEKLQKEWSEPSNIKIVTMENNVGWPASLNAGINYAEGNTIVWLNNDLEVTHGWLDKMYKHLVYEDSIGIVGPVSNFVMGLQKVELNKIFNKIGNHHEVNYLIGFCMMIKDKCLEKVGWVDETFWDIEAKSGSADDIDYSIRATEAGFKLIIDRTTFIHHHGSKSFVAIFGEDLYKQGTEAHKKYSEDVEKYVKRLKEKWGEEKVEQTLTLPPMPDVSVGTIGIPHGDQFPAETVHCLMSAKIPEDVSLIFNYGSAVAKARNNIVEQMTGEWLVFIDSDMTFNEEAILKLVANLKDENVDICTAVAYRKVPNFEPCIFKKAAGNNPHYHFIGDWPKDRLFEIDACGSAFVAIKRKVFEALQSPWYSYSDFLSEDLNFCRRAKDYGFRIWCDPTIAIGHIKGFPFGEMVYRNNPSNAKIISNAQQNWPELWNYGIKKEPSETAKELMRLQKRADVKINKDL